MLTLITLFAALAAAAPVVNEPRQRGGRPHGDGPGNYYDYPRPTGDCTFYTTFDGQRPGRFGFGPQKREAPTMFSPYIPSGPEETATAIAAQQTDLPLSDNSLTQPLGSPTPTILQLFPRDDQLEFQPSATSVTSPPPSRSSSHTTSSELPKSIPTVLSRSTEHPAPTQSVSSAPANQVKRQASSSGSASLPATGNPISAEPSVTASPQLPPNGYPNGAPSFSETPLPSSSSISTVRL